jgi:hypothetical protein
MAYPKKKTKQSDGPNRFRESLDKAGVSAQHGAELPLHVLEAAGILNVSGAAGADANRKIKQIKHFLNLIRPALDDVFARYPEPVIVDAGAGRSALSLVIHELWVRRLGRGSTWAVESRPELCKRVRDAAERLKFDNFHVVDSTILEAELPERVHFVLALHACDTATDEALAIALRRGADHVAAVPCCQAELARQLGALKADAKVATLWQHAWHRREFGAHLTNVLRAMTLQAHGYQVTVTELAGWEHTPKNELILGRRVARFHKGAFEARTQLLAEIPVEPRLLALVPAPAFEPAHSSSPESSDAAPIGEINQSTSSTGAGTASETAS